MDKFVTRAPKNSQNAAGTKSTPKPLKQATIKQLSGVVVLEELRKHKRTLESTTSSDKKKVAALKALRKKKPSRDVLKKTKLGKIIHKLCTHPSESVADAAQIVYQHWKKHIDYLLSRKPITVQKEAKTKALEENVLKNLEKALGSDEHGKEVAKSVENYTRKCTGNLMNRAYKQSLRRMSLLLKYRAQNRDALLKGTMKVEDFVNQYFKA